MTHSITTKGLYLAAAFAIAMTNFTNCSDKEAAGYIGQSDIAVEDGKMTPEVMLSLGRLSDPQLSPDGKTILYGVSYTSVPDNRSCRNLFLVNADGTCRRQLTREGSSISCARWTDGGRGIMYIQKGQLRKATVRGLSGNSPKLVKKTVISDIPAGISEFKLSPDGSRIMFVSTVKGAVSTPADSDPALDKATAYKTDDLMYRHWDHWVTEVPHTFIASLDKPVNTESSIDILAGENEVYELPTEPFSGIEQLDDAQLKEDSRRTQQSRLSDQLRGHFRVA